MEREKIEKIIEDSKFFNLAYKHVIQNREYKKYNFKDIDVVLDISCLRIEKENCCDMGIAYENIDLFIIDIDKYTNSLVIQVVNLNGMHTNIYTRL